MHKDFQYIPTHTLEQITASQETGEVIDHYVKTTGYVTKSKEEFYLVYMQLFSVFQKITMPEIRVYAYLLLNFTGHAVIPTASYVKKDIMVKTKLSMGAINNTFTLLTTAQNDCPALLIKVAKGIVKINPRYAFKGSSQTRNDTMKAMIELEYKDC